MPKLDNCLSIVTALTHPSCRSSNASRCFSTCHAAIPFFTFESRNAVQPFTLHTDYRASRLCHMRGIRHVTFLDSAWTQRTERQMENMSSYRGTMEGMKGWWRVGQMCRWSDHSWINSLLFGPATLIRTLTPCGLQRSNLGAGEPKRIHSGELEQQGGITLYQINCTIIHVQSCCIIKASVLLFHDKINYGYVFSSRV